MKELRPWVMWAAALAVVGIYTLTDPDGGKETALRLQWLSWVLVLAGPVYLLRRALMDRARGREAYEQAMGSPVGAGLVFLGLCLLTGLLFLALAGVSHGGELPPRALEHLPTLKEEAAIHWHQAPVSMFAGQIEQETCYSLTHRKCWSPSAELKTSREYGFGLGQLTVTKRFDNFAAARGLHASLRDWQWEDRYNARRQIRTMVLMDRGNFASLQRLVPDRSECYAMALAAYNGGLGGVLSDRRLCAALDGCDPGKWWGNVELHSLKAKKPANGYGKSFFEINREYPANVLGFRADRYKAWLGEGET